ncbi:hypothetical protein PR003_g3339 [Phytophthora rubi]|uniref:Pectate lyase n=1 Tax=Phytophthora rubi TaxID=129364 RepID=A0A6A3NV72_9STRA|nr:hypothetical protein PR002_g2458 [Phytophthora rubi]KAE9049306.1 hypothetical protein PR001_g3438 [Phytophthora rubi]KAE9354467.1 hypothetical protein PR003_g3339 [Phytophthora rubi]
MRLRLVISFLQTVLAALCVSATLVTTPVPARFASGSFTAISDSPCHGTACRYNGGVKILSPLYS